MNRAAYRPEIVLKPVDITPWREGNQGVPYVHTFDSGKPGPHVMVNALTHGNEVCGAHALTFLLGEGVRPTRGKLTLSFANVGAYESFDPEYPFVSRFLDEDFNRLWNEATLDGPRQSRELARARALRPFLDECDHLLDIHSTELPQAPMLLAGTRRKNVDLARKLGFPAHVVVDGGHKAGKRIRDYAKFDDPDQPNQALLVECGSHFEAAARDVAIQTTLRFLKAYDVLETAFLKKHLSTAPVARQIVVEVTEPVTVATDRFRFVEDYRGFDIVKPVGTVIGYDGDAPVATPYADCVLVMPARAPVKGNTAVRLGRLLD